MAMSGGAGTPQERTARATERLYPALMQQQKKLDEMTKLMAQWGIIV